MRFKIERALLDVLDDEAIIQSLAAPIGRKTRRLRGKIWSAYSANPHLSRAQINIVLIGETTVEVINGGVFQLIMNPSGSLLPDLPGAFRDIGREREAALLDEVVTMFPDEATLRDHEKRIVFTSSRIVPGGWEGLIKAQATKSYVKLDRLGRSLGGLLQSASFFRAVAAYVTNEAGSFQVVGT